MYSPFASQSQIYYNGSEVSSYLDGPSNTTKEELFLSTGLLEIGGLGLTICVDECKLWTRTISPGEMLDAHFPVDVVRPQTSPATSSQTPQATTTSAMHTSTNLETFSSSTEQQDITTSSTPTSSGLCLCLLLELGIGPQWHHAELMWFNRCKETLQKLQKYVFCKNEKKQLPKIKFWKLRRNEQPN